MTSTARALIAPYTALARPVGLPDPSRVVAACRGRDGQLHALHRPYVGDGLVLAAYMRDKSGRLVASFGVRYGADLPAVHAFMRAVGPVDQLAAA